MSQNVFSQYSTSVYPYQFDVRILVERLMGGTPSDPDIAAGWLKAKLGITAEDQIRRAVSETMAERGVTEEQALVEVKALRHLNGFKKEPDGGLYVEGRIIKAMIKEAASVARGANRLPARMGGTNKGVLSFVAEHIHVTDSIVRIGQTDGDKIVDVTEPTGIQQSFPKNPRTKQTGIQNTEYVDNAVLDFTVVTDWPFCEDEWAIIFLTGGMQGLGSARSQGYGRYQVKEWKMRPTSDPVALANLEIAAKAFKVTKEKLAKEAALSLRASRASGTAE